MEGILVIMISGLTTAFGLGVATVTLYLTFNILHKIFMVTSPKE